MTAASSRSSSAVSAAFSLIPLAPVRVGEGEAPPSWDPVQTPKATGIISMFRLIFSLHADASYKVEVMTTCWCSA
ncbi:unnamed protein product [Urochloa humidicola]